MRRVHYMPPGWIVPVCGSRPTQKTTVVQHKVTCARCRRLLEKPQTLGGGSH